MLKATILILIASLILLGLILLINSIYNKEPIIALPLIHQPHTHEHKGLACCPCGGCHKHDEGEETLPEEIPLLARILSLTLAFSIILL